MQKPNRKPFKPIYRGPRINNQIRAPRVRLIGSEGENLGEVAVEEALAKAKEAELDLIEISPKAQPPVCRIMDYGKYLYQQKKKAREASKKAHTTEVRDVRIGLGTSQHDLEMKAKKASEFLEAGDKVKIDLVLKGRAKYMNRDFLNERMQRVIQLISVPHKIADGPKKGPRGIWMLIEKTK